MIARMANLREKRRETGGDSLDPRRTFAANRQIVLA